MKQTNPKESKDYSVLLFIASTIAVVTILFINWRLLHYRGPEIRGTAGDMFGVSTSLFSGLGFAAIVITLYMQRRQILDSQLTSSEQLAELIKQRKLSLMPAFVIRPPGARGANSELINIGNGTAVNIRLDEFSITVRGKYQIDSISHRPVTFLPPSGVMDMLPTDSNPSLTEGAGGDQTIDRIRYAFGNENFAVRITFEDIEGTRYEQSLTMKRNICIPSPVNQLN